MNIYATAQRHLGDLLQSGRLDRVLDRWRWRHEALADMPNAQALCELCGPDARDRTESDAVLRAVCAEAARGGDIAQTVLLGSFAKGLRAQVRDLYVRGGMDSEDLTMEAFKGFWEGVGVVTDSSRYVAWNLLRRARLGAVRAMLAEQQHQAPLESLEATERDMAEDLRGPGDPDTVALARAIVEDAVAQGVITAEQALLVLATPEECARIIQGGRAARETFYRRRVEVRQRLRLWLKEMDPESFV